MKRMFDFLLASMLLLLLFPLILIISILIKVTSAGPIIYWSDRVGQYNRIFKMPKFRTMKVGTPVVATHELTNPHLRMTPIGSILRRSSLDEIPQLWCIILGEMSFVGPRPALFNQNDLISLRISKCVHECVPGLTGLAQINGRDDLSIEDKVKYDSEYMERMSLLLDAKIIFLTAIKSFSRDNVAH